MWRCKKCGEENEDTFDSCWSCGTSQDGTQSTDTKEFKLLKEDVVRRHTMDKKLVENIRKNMESKSTADLEQILDKNDKNEYSGEAFEAIRQVLEGRRKNPLPQQVQSQGIRESNNQTVKEDAADGETFTRYTTTYGTARMIAQCVSFVGWIVVTIGCLILIVSLFQSTKDHSFALMGLIPAFAAIISGLLLVMIGQMTRATIDTADNTGQMLVVLKNKKYK
jgi:hypothetical protein